MPITAANVLNTRIDWRAKEPPRWMRVRRVVVVIGWTWCLGGSCVWVIGVGAVCVACAAVTRVKQKNAATRVVSRHAGARPSASGLPKLVDMLACLQVGIVFSLLLWRKLFVQVGRKLFSCQMPIIVLCHAKTPYFALCCSKRLPAGSYFMNLYQ